MANYTSAAKGSSINGAAYVAPTGTTLPTDASAELDAAFINLGYVSEDGLTNSNSPDSEQIKDWTGSNVLTIQSGREDKFTFTLLGALDAEVQKLIYGDANVEGTFEKGMTIKANQTELEGHVFVFDMAVKGGLKRVVVPNGWITSVGDITYSGSDAIKYELEITALQDDAGENHYEYTIQK